MSDDLISSVEKRRVPDALLQRMHDANQQLHGARQKLEGIMDALESSHQDHVDAAGRQLRAAEQAVEEINIEIQKALAGMPRPTSS